MNQGCPGMFPLLADNNVNTAYMIKHQTFTRGVRELQGWIRVKMTWYFRAQKE